MKIDQLGAILKKKDEIDFYYPQDKYNYIISLMKKFELCYEINKETVLVPDLLEVQEPSFNFDYNTALRFIIQYVFLPRSVMPRFIVKVHKDIKDNLHWRTGVVLENDESNSSAVIKSDNEANRIYIYVNGEQKRDYFSFILFNFREINKSFEKLEVVEKIPIPNEPKIAIGYKHLIKLELKGIETYIPDGSDNEYNVSDLLGTIINRSDWRTLLEEILRSVEMNRSDEHEMLKILQKLEEIEDYDNEKTLLEKLNNIIIAEPNFCGIGVRFNEIIKMYIRSKKPKTIESNLLINS